MGQINSLSKNCEIPIHPFGEATTTAQSSVVHPSTPLAFAGKQPEAVRYDQQGSAHVGGDGCPQ